MDFDFGGYATRNNIQCSDGRVICKDAFKDQDHAKVPLVYQHDHMSINNVLGHGILENRDDGVYVYGKFNDTEAGRSAREAVKNGDISALSIYANRLKQHGSNVIHGAIREVSLVLAGANPGAYIDTVMVHSDDDTEEAEICFVDEKSSIVFHSEKSEEEEKLTHEDKKSEEDMPSNSNSGSEKTVQDVIDSMNEEQKNVLYAL